MSRHTRVSFPRATWHVCRRVARGEIVIGDDAPMRNVAAQKTAGGLLAARFLI